MHINSAIKSFCELWQGTVLCKIIWRILFVNVSLTNAGFGILIIKTATLQEIEKSSGDKYAQNTVKDIRVKNGYYRSRGAPSDNQHGLPATAG